MIGRGTRRCENLFGEGMDKTEFIPKPQKTSLQVRFGLMCNIVSIIRRFVGVDEEELNRTFEEFIQAHHNKMSATQMKTLELIKNEIAKNKGISFASLFAAPYTSFNPNGVDGIFGRMADEVFDLIAPYRASYIS